MGRKRGVHGMFCIVCGCLDPGFRCPQCPSFYCSAACYKIHRRPLEEEKELVAKREKEAPDTTAASTKRTDSVNQFSYLCEVIVAQQEPEREREVKRQRAEAEADVFSDLSREKAVTSAASGAQHTRAEHNTVASPLPRPSTPAEQSGVNNDAVACPVPTADAPAAIDESPTLAAPQQPASGAAAEGSEVAVDADAVYILQEKHLSVLANDPNVRGALRSPSLQRLIRTIDASRSRLDALDAAQYNNADFKRFCNEVMRAIAKAEGR